MATSILEQYRIADFLEWNAKHVLKLNPEFQRREVWTPAAKILLIDTILRRLPIPKVFIRTKVDVRTKTSLREIVDGQQRLRAIIDFANDEILLSRRAKEFDGYRYSTLSEELKETFLTYPIAVDQLINASDEDVLEVFSRLNSYTVTLNQPELRHAKYQGNFRWAVHDGAKRWERLWTKFHVIGIRERFRMLDDSLMAEMFGVLLQGITEGGQGNINKIYAKYDGSFPEPSPITVNLDNVLSFIVDNMGQVIVGPLAGPPHFLMLFAAVAHALVGVPPGDMKADMPERSPEWLTDITFTRMNVARLRAYPAK